MTDQERAAAAEAEAKAKADAEAAAKAAEEQKAKDVDYWKNEAKKAFEARDRAKEEAKLVHERGAEPPAKQPAQEDLNELYWQKPAEVIGRLVQQYVEPFVEDRYELQKQKYAGDPDFQKYAPAIDQMVKAQPALRQQPGIVDKLYRAARAMDFDPNAEKERIRQEVLKELQTKQGGAVEGAGAAAAGGGAGQLPDLSSDEKRVAEKFYPDLPQADAYKKYAENKGKWMQGA